LPSPLVTQIPAFVANLLTTYSQATPENLIAGRAWYPRSYAGVQAWAAHYGRTDANVAAIIAAVSPQCSWEDNLLIANDILQSSGQPRGGALLGNVVKAERIRDEGIEDTRLVFPVGPKVWNFSRNLAGEWQRAVTVDTHMVQVTFGSPTANRTLKWAAYDAVACAIKRAAAEADEIPAHFQAITWLTWKQMYPRIVKRELRRTY